MIERWLIIAHEATNSGGPRMLLETLRGVKAARGPDWSCKIILRRGGVLLPEFARLGPVYLLSHDWAEGQSFRAGILRKFIDRPWLQPWRMKKCMRQLSGSKFDLVYNNTATNGYLTAVVRSLGCPVLTHVHELKCVLRHFISPRELAKTLDNSDHFLAVSPAVLADLKDLGVSEEKITIAANFLPSLPDEIGESKRFELRERLNLPPDAFVIAGCGHVHPLKGTDLFVEVAALFSGLTGKKLIFVWIGGETDERFARKVRRLVSRRKLENVMRFVGPVQDPSPWFAASDVVAVTSRVESFSLVALEAAALGRLVVGFSGARGLAGLLGDRPGLLVPDYDLPAMASVLHAMLENPQTAREHGQQLRRRVAKEFLAGPGIATILKAVDDLRQKTVI